MAIGAGDADGTPKLVGISHECDEPERVRALPRVTTSTIDPHAVSGEIDRAVRTALAADSTFRVPGRRPPPCRMLMR